jgi:UDP-glucose 4-epimerase
MLGRLISDEKPKCLIHCAGSANVAASIRDPLQDWQSNVATTASIYSAVARHSPQTRIIYLSSAAVYGQPTSFPITEATPVAPLSPYGHHKHACELMGIAMHEQAGIDVINLRIFSAYGAGLRKQVLWDIYQKALQSPTVVLEGDGTETRDLINVDDIVRLINQIVQCSSPLPRLLNVASGESIDIASLAEQFLLRLGIKREVRFSGYRSPGVPMRWAVDISLLEQFSDAPKVPLDVGLSQYADWLRYREGGDDARRILAAAG